MHKCISSADTPTPPPTTPTNAFPQIRQGILSISGSLGKSGTPHGTPKAFGKSPLESPLVRDPQAVKALNLEPGMTKVGGGGGRENGGFRGWVAVGSSGERSVPVTRALLGAAAGVLDSSTAAAWVLSKVGAVPVIGACQHGGVGMAVSSCIGRVVSAVLGWVRECWSVWWLACCLLYATVPQCAVCLHAWCILFGWAERCGLLSDPCPPPPVEQGRHCWLCQVHRAAVSICIVQCIDC